MKSLENNGIVVINPNMCLAKAQKTIVVLGLPRSGTSMIGKVLYELGIFHDDGYLNKNVYEDKMAIDVFENNVNKLNEYIRNQNNKYNIWGFKRPGAYYYIDKYVHQLRNPIYIVPFKDLLAMSLRKNISIDMDFSFALKETMKQSNELIQFLDRTKVPMILFSYEKAILNPSYFVNEIVRILSLNNISDSKIDNAVNAITINPEDYLNSSRIKVDGRVENLSNGILSGWAKSTIDDRFVEVRVYDLQDNLIANTIASIFREDLKINSIGNGRHAFQVKIPENLTISQIVVKAGKHNDILKLSKFLSSK